MKNHVLGVYDSLEEAERALETLAHKHLPQERISVITPEEPREQVVNYISSRDVLGKAAELGGLWGAAIGVVIAYLIFITLQGALGEGSVAARLFLTFLLGATLGALTGAVLGGLLATSLAREMNGKLNQRLFAGKYVILMESSRKIIKEARKALEGHSPTPAPASMN